MAVQSSQFKKTSQNKRSLMGSDSRTATATSSKPRPKWRDRHLNQLSTDQLQQVKAHRNDSTAQSAEIQFDDTQPLQQQAGPVPDSQSKRARKSADTASRSSVEDSSDKQRTRHAEKKPQYHRDERDHARHETRRESPPRPSRTKTGNSSRTTRATVSGREDGYEERHDDRQYARDNESQCLSKK